MSTSVSNSCKRIQLLEQATRHSSRTKSASNQTGKSTGIVGVKTIVTNQGQEQSATQIGTITTEQQAQTGTGYWNQILPRVGAS